MTNYILLKLILINNFKFIIYSFSYDSYLLNYNKNKNNYIKLKKVDDLLEAIFKPLYTNNKFFLKKYKT